MLRKINGNTKPHKVRDQNDRNDHSKVLNYLVSLNLLAIDIYIIYERCNILSALEVLMHG